MLADDGLRLRFAGQVVDIVHMILSYFLLHFLPIYNFIIAKKDTISHEILMKMANSVTEIFLYCSSMRTSSGSRFFLRISSYCLTSMIDFD